jgi:large subunit ribosomal protein L7A
VKKVVGTKQVIKAIKNDKTKEVFLALDTDEDLKDKILDQCKKNNVKVNYIESKKELGEKFGIGINAATAAILI